MPPIDISVVIPCFNVAPYLKACIDSVNDQIYKPIEIILVEDGSTDQTKEVAAKCKSVSHIPIQIYLQDHKGSAQARNLGLELSKGDYIQFLDADDVLMPDKIKHQVDLIVKTSYPDVVAGSFRRTDIQGKEIHQRIIKKDEFVWDSLIQSRLGITSSNLWKKASLISVGGWNIEWKSSQEYECMFRLLTHQYSILKDEKVDTLVMDRPFESISNTNFVENLKRYTTLRCNILAYMVTQKMSISTSSYDFVFAYLQKLYRFDTELAIALYVKAGFPTTFVPSPSKAVSSFYRMSYRLLGFSQSERYLGTYRYLSSKLKSILKKHFRLT